MRDGKWKSWLRWMALCCTALAALEFAAFYQFNGNGWLWDWVVHSSPAGTLVLAAGALFLALANGLTWRLKSPSGDRSLRSYWAFCGGLMLLCLIWSDIDSSFHMVLLLLACFATPLGIVGAGLGALPDGVRYTLCYGTLLVLSGAEYGYHSWLLRRHQAQGQAMAEGGECGHGPLDL